MTLFTYHIFLMFSGSGCKWVCGLESLKVFAFFSWFELKELTVETNKLIFKGNQVTSFDAGAILVLKSLHPVKTCESNIL